MSLYPSYSYHNSGLTIVIATLGGEVLNQTLKSINASSVLPSEILICIPAEFKEKVKNLEKTNVKIIDTCCIGQVAQRAFGFNIAANEFVMQLDDDMTLDSRCIEFLMESCKSENYLSVGPSLINNYTGSSVYKISSYKKYLRHFYSLILNGKWQFTPGSVDGVGTPFGVDPEGREGLLKNLDWIAGGCVMHKKENLIHHNFYPFKGKAYGEDVIHSYLLRAKGINLAMDPRAKCGIEMNRVEHDSISTFLKGLIADFKVRKYYMALNGRMNFRAYIYYIGMLVLYFCKKIKHYFK